MSEELNLDDEIEEDDNGYPWEDVEAARRDIKLQRRKVKRDAKANYLPMANACPKCGAPAEKLAWFYFSSPDETWAFLCGRAGWMTVCDACHRQVDFFLEVMN